MKALPWPPGTLVDVHDVFETVVLEIDTCGKRFRREFKAE